ncbi:MAG: aminoacyl-tRNA hydrolase [Candidatus Obscuribacterales bacterium]|nr:aminoacyl-tRNA hydrolase [Candidatus Obscuribacterales bacterium]
MALKLIMGLGNPEARYEMTRHNAGFICLEKLAIKCGASFAANKQMHSDFCKCNWQGNSLILAKPQTYMNLSGKAAQAIVNFYKLDRNEILVAHDDVSLPLGVIRMARGGGAGGQHGVESIIEMLGNKDFHRLKIGVGPDPGGSLRASYVLSEFPESERELYFKVISLAVEAIEVWMKEGVQVAMNRYNGVNLQATGTA